MPRPAGFVMSRTAWDDFLVLSGKKPAVVAEMAGIKDATLRGIVNGFQGASAPMAHRLAKAMGVQPETLFPDMRVDERRARKSKAAS